MTVSSVFAGETNAPTDDLLIRFAQQRRNAVLITETPVRMDDAAAFACAEPRDLKQQRELGIANPHWPKYVNVYVTPEDASAMQTNSASFSRGSIILKEKFDATNGAVGFTFALTNKIWKTELFTGMVKREAGYNPECGDWEFFTLSADANKVTSRGKLESCMACHVEYKESDFVTKKYVHASNSPFGFQRPGVQTNDVYTNLPSQH